MGYATSLTTRQRNFKRRRNEVSDRVGPKIRMLATLEATLSRFWVLMDINDDMKGEVFLLTRYLVDYFWRFGYKRASQKFAKEANIDLEQPLDGTFWQYSLLFMEGNNCNVDYWTFFWYKKLNELKEDTFKGKALNITTPIQQPLSVDQDFTSTSRRQFYPQQGGQDNGHAFRSQVERIFADKDHPLRTLYQLMHFYPQQGGQAKGTFMDKGMIHKPKRFLYHLLRTYINAYFGRIEGNLIRGVFVEKSEFDEEKPYGMNILTHST